jgi:ubiquinone/menaquinone biosynthesis C-methylase UbiE
MRAQTPLALRLLHENMHGEVVLRGNESNWGWSTTAGQIRKKRRESFLTAPVAGIGDNPRVLEVGCGTGTFSGTISSVYSSLTCIDISDPLLRAASERYQQIDFKKEDIHQTSFPDASFDLVLGCSVLHHLDWDLALREIRRILKPRGQLRFSEPNLLNPQIFLQKNWPWLKRRLGDSPDEYAFTPGQIRRSLEKLDFSNIQVNAFEFLHPATSPSMIPMVIKLEAALERTPMGRFGGSIKIAATRP